jgi:hypothetical protein
VADEPQSIRIGLAVDVLGGDDLEAGIVVDASAGVTGWSKDLTEPSGSVMRGMGGLPWCQGRGQKNKAQPDGRA